MSDTRILIPARRNSKGLRFKNRKLFSYTIDSIPKELLCRVTVSTDDENIIEICKDLGIHYIDRPWHLADDEASMKSVVEHYVKTVQPDDRDSIVVMYLTYPQRKWEDVEAALKYMNDYGASSLLGRVEINGTHPYLYMREVNGICGEQLTPHNLYRRQSYPVCFEISHYLCITKAWAVSGLNSNMYADNTIFYRINNKVIDVDSESDLQEFNKAIYSTTNK